MEIRLANENDCVEIIDIIKQAQAYLKENGIDQWQNGYPNVDTIQEDIKRKHSYVLIEKGSVVGTGVLSFEKDPYYEKIEGQWLSNEPYGVIHRLAIKASYKGNEYSSQFFKFCELQALQNGVNYIRIDTHELNRSMERCIEKKGYQKCGGVCVLNHAPRIAYEKRIVDEV